MEIIISIRFSVLASASDSVTVLTVYVVCEQNRLPSGVTQLI